MWFTQHSANNSNPLNEHKLTFLVQENRNHWESGLKFHLLLHKRCLSSCRTHWHKTQMFIHYHKFYMVSELTGNKKKTSLWACLLQTFFTILITGPWLNDVTWHGCSPEVMVIYQNRSADPTIMFIAGNVFLFSTTATQRFKRAVLCVFKTKTE